MVGHEDQESVVTRSPLKAPFNCIVNVAKVSLTLVLVDTQSNTTEPETLFRAADSASALAARLWPEPLRLI
jgi:hypothetical protein